MHTSTLLATIISAAAIVSAIPQATTNTFSAAFVCDCSSFEERERFNRLSETACKKLASSNSFSGTTFKFNTVDKQCDVYNAPPTLLNDSTIFKAFNAACKPNNTVACRIYPDDPESSRPNAITRDTRGRYVRNGKLFTGSIDGVQIKDGEPFTGTKNGKRYVDGVEVKRVKATVTQKPAMPPTPPPRRSPASARVTQSISTSDAAAPSPGPFKESLRVDSGRGRS